MTEQEKLVKELYEALDQHIAHHLGRDRGAQARAVKVLRINKNLVYEKNHRPKRPQKTSLVNLVQTGGPRLSAAAQNLLDFISADSRGVKTENFSLLYVGMQLWHAQYHGLLNGFLESQKQEWLELGAAAAIVGCFAEGSLLLAKAEVADTDYEPVTPRDLQTARDKDYGELLAELSELANQDSIQLYRRISQFGEFAVKPRVGPFSAKQAAASIIAAYVFHYVAYRAAHTLVSDADVHPSLRRRPLFKIASEVYRLLERSVDVMTADVWQALRQLAVSEKEEAKRYVEHVNRVARCVSGNCPSAWSNERVVITLAHDGVRLHYLMSPVEGDRFYQKQFVPLEAYSPSDAAEVAFFDARLHSAAAADGQPSGQLDERLVPIFKELLARHKSWKPPTNPAL